MQSSFTCFVDESGNTGPNLTEASQPIFVHAGVFVPNAQVEATRALAKELHQACLPKSNELHVGILNTSEGRNRVGMLLPALAKLQVVPLISIMERRCIHAYYVIDTCFDSGWNDLADEKYMSSAEAKQKLAQLIVDAASEDQLRAFADAFRAREASVMSCEIDTIAQKLESAGHGALSVVLRGAKERIADQCESIRSLDATGVGMNTINASSFAVLLAMCERTAAQKSLEHGELVHDQSPQFPAYTTMFEFGKKLTDSYNWDNGQVSVPIRRVSTLKQGDSKSEPLLQLADVVAGLFRRLTAKKDRLRDPEFDRWLVYVVREANTYANAMISRQLAERVWSEPLNRQS